MAIKIGLDHQAVKKLIDSDPEFAIEVKKAVLGEIVRKELVQKMSDTLRIFIIGEIKQQIEENVGKVPEVSFNRVTAGGVIKEPFAKMIRNMVSQQITDEVEKIVYEQVNNSVTGLKKRVDQWLVEYKSQMNELVNNTISKDIAFTVDRMVKDRLTAIVNSLNKEAKAA